MKKHILIFLKGIAMGMADIVPGVSGGTIALVTGIYEKLIDSIDRLDITLLRTLKKKGWVATWEYINGNFLLALFLGIGVAVLSVSKMLTWLLENSPEYLWSFFFGLVLASIFLVGKIIERWSLTNVIALIIGVLVAFGITILDYSEGSDNLLYLFLCGMLAIIAMILPGISGAFILVLLGAYSTVLKAVHNLTESITNKDWLTFTDAIQKVAIVGLGAIIGLKLFSKILKWMFTHHRNLVLSILVGFMIGSLNKIWPWKTTIQKITTEGKTVLSQSNYNPLGQVDIVETIFAVVLIVTGFMFVYIIEKTSIKK